MPKPAAHFLQCRPCVRLLPRGAVRDPGAPWPFPSPGTPGTPVSGAFLAVPTMRGALPMRPRVPRLLVHPGSIKRRRPGRFDDDLMTYVKRLIYMVGATGIEPVTPPV